MAGARNHLRAFARRVEVAEDEFRIMGSTPDMLQTSVAASIRQSLGSVRENLD